MDIETMKAAGSVIIKEPQNISEGVIDLCENDEAIMAIFESSNPDEYLNQVLALCVRRGITIYKSREELIRNYDGESDLINYLSCVKLKKSEQLITC